MAEQRTGGQERPEPTTTGPSEPATSGPSRRPAEPHAQTGRPGPSGDSGPVGESARHATGGRALVRVPVRLPGVLRELAAGSREIQVEVPAGCDVAEVFDVMRHTFPALERRIRDERGELRPHVNVFVDDTNVRDLAQQATKLPVGAELHVIPAVSGG